MSLGFVGVPASALVIGAVIGLTYALLAAGLLLVYRATRVINFAHGQIGALCATVLAKLVLDEGWNYLVALVAVVGLGAALGGLVELTIIRRLFLAPRLQLFVATLGVAQLFLLAQFLLPSVEAVGLFPSPLPWSLTFGDVRLSSPEIMVLLVAPPTVLVMGWFLNRTRAGLAIRGTSDNPDMAELSGMSVRRVSTMVWVISGALAALTSVLLFPVLGLALNAPTGGLGPGLLLPALAAALVGRLSSLSWTLAGGVGVGILQSLLVVNFPRTPGVVQLLMFAVILVLVLVRQIPGRDDQAGERSLALRVAPLPEPARALWWAGSLGRLVAVAGLLVAVALPWLFPSAGRIFLFSNVLVVAIAGLSVTVLTGWAGQLSLGQYALVGLGALTASTLVSKGYSFPVAVGYAVVAGVVAAVLVGFPALRIKGLFLAVTTLAFAVAAQSWLFRLDLFRVGDDQFFHLPRTELFGLIDLHSQRTYYYLCLVALVAATGATTRLGRSGIRRTFVAVSDNEPCASSFGLSVTAVKLCAFGFAGGLAALAGALYAGLHVIFTLDSNGEVTPFGPEQSLLIVAMVVIGGLGSVSGSILGAVYVVGLPALFQHNQLVGIGSTAIGLLALLLFAPGGLASLGYRIRDAAITRALKARLPAPPVLAMDKTERPLASRPALRDSGADGETGAPINVLDVRDISVRFGGIDALSKVSIQVRPGEIVGLIGSNGAGKSTLMNVISGFQPPSDGQIRLWGDDATTLPSHERARLGVGRVFQDARLFGDLTVSETVKVSLEVHERTEFVPALLGYPPARRQERRRSSEASELIDVLGLGQYADVFISDLSTGTRRIVELTCLLARGSRLLLLDEPTAGVAQRETEAFGPLIQRIRAQLDAAVLIVEHDMPMVMSVSDHIYCLDAGHQIAEGPPATVRQDPAVIAAYMGTDERAIARQRRATNARHATRAADTDRGCRLEKEGRGMTTLRRGVSNYRIGVGVVVGILVAGLAFRITGDEPRISSTITGSEETGRGPTAGTGTATTTASNLGVGDLGPGAASTGASGGAGAAAGGPAAASDVGVTESTIKVGVAILDTSKLAAFAGGDVFGELASVDSQRKIWRAFIDDVNREGGILGRTIQPAYYTLDVTSPSDQRAACNQWTETDRVFAVFALGSLSVFGGAGELCVAVEHQTLLIEDTPQTVAASFAKAGGLIINGQSSATRAIGDMAYALDHYGKLSGRKIGLITDQGQGEAIAKEGLIPALGRLGQALVYTAVVSTDPSQGPAQAVSQVAQMRAAGVDAVIDATSFVNMTAFVSAAQNQGWRPRYLVSSYDGNDAATFLGGMPSSFDGATVITYNPYDASASHPEDAVSASCRDRYNQLTGSTYKPGDLDATTLPSITRPCAQLRMFVAAGTAVGSSLSRRALSSAVQAPGFPVLMNGLGGSWGPGKTDYNDVVRPMVWGPSDGSSHNCTQNGQRCWNDAGEPWNPRSKWPA